MYCLLLVVLVAAATVRGEGVKYLECGLLFVIPKRALRVRSGSKGAELVSVDVLPCKGAPAGCELKRGTLPVITIAFKPSMCPVGGK
jgi:hypothetical protein